MSSPDNASKNGLGRGLTDLMARPGLVAPHSLPSSGPVRTVGPGMSTLLEGSRRFEPDSAPVFKTPEVPAHDGSEFRTLKWTLIFADVLLVCLSCFVVSGSNEPIGFSEILLCALALGTGAALSLFAIRIHFRHC
ncbi:MAG: hypothetical protein K9N62_16690 [Verrucomicrobia bacterium]|jgi:hypothetical protein|nr:hypothetical protein [Verrucomicrobiota bacterium]